MLSKKCICLGLQVMIIPIKMTLECEQLHSSMSNFRKQLNVTSMHHVMERLMRPGDYIWVQQGKNKYVVHIVVRLAKFGRHHNFIATPHDYEGSEVKLTSVVQAIGFYVPQASMLQVLDFV